MDIEDLLKNVNSLTEYIAVTQDASQKCKSSKIQISVSTAHALKKIRSYEIEHINKCEENGIACIIFERLLNWAPAQIWRVVSKELVILLQYWLDAVRKHLVNHSPHWWPFLKLLLKFIKEISQKHTCIPNILTELTSECLLDLATNNKPDALQKFEILHCFNIYCADSTRELRFTLRNKFADYFTKLGVYMCSCGHLPTQYSIIECLLRWMLPRKDQALRIACASKWFPARLYSEEVVDIFLARPWSSFLEDARDLLNKHNDSGDLITSVVCRKLSVGDIVIIPNSDEMGSWLDINSASKSLTVLLGPRALEKFGCPLHKSFEIFYVSSDNTHTANLHRQSRRLVLSVETVSSPQITPSRIKVGDDVSCHVTIVVTSQCDVHRLDKALRNIFDDKYQMLLDKEGEDSPPPTAVDDIPAIITEEQKKKIETMLNNLRRQLTQTQANETTDLITNDETEQQARPSHQVKAKPPRDTGYKTLRLRQPVSCASPSTASTSSLAQLHEKLAALPRHKFDREPEWTCAAPDLSVVAEVSEPDDRSTSTIEYRACGVLSFSSRRSQSDNESIRKYPSAIRKRKSRPLSPLVQYNTTLAATIEVAEDSVINDTSENIAKSTDLDAINVDLLYQEAIEASQEKNKDKNDSGINTSVSIPIGCPDENENVDTIEDTPNERTHCLPKKKSKVIFSTSDESNTEAISDTPNVYVTTRRNKKVTAKASTIERPSFDVQMVEDFFSQHFNENKVSDIVVSPKLAGKLNESSEATDDLQDVIPYDFNEFEVLECLNNIVDKVCDDFDKCTKYLNKEQDTVTVDNYSDLEDNIPLKDIMNKIQDIETKKQTTKKSPKTIKLRYKAGPMKDKTKPRTMKRKNKLELKSTSKISSQVEANVENTNNNLNKTNICKVPEENVIENEKEFPPGDTTNAPTTPVVRKKRKLFSPKDEQISEEAPALTQPEETLFTDSKIHKTPKVTGVYKPYKEIEKERKRIRTSRNRKSKNVEPESPRSKKMNDLFNKVKESANGEQVTLASKSTDLDVYNFSTDSEDDFKEKKIGISKKNSTTTIESGESTILRRGRVVKRVDYSSKRNSKSAKPKVNKRQLKKKINKESELIDERMRETKETLDSYIVIENTKAPVSEPELVLKNPPQMEVITEHEESANETRQRTRKTRKNKGKPVETVKSTKKTLSVKDNTDNNRTESPLPGLVVEEAPVYKKEDADLSANMVDKFKKICQNPEKYINESNTTQNLLSDNDRNVYSPQTIDITNEMLQVEAQINAERKPKRKISKNKKTSSIKSTKSETKLLPPKTSLTIVNITTSETKSDQSIATVGITGHGDSEEQPPSPRTINERLEHRNLQTEYLDDTTKDYFDKLTEEINYINDICRNDYNELNDSRPTNKTDEDEMLNNNLKNNLKNVVSPKSLKSPVLSTKYMKSPVVSIERISLEDISRWLPSRRNSESDYNSQSSSKSNSKSKNGNRYSNSPKISDPKCGSDDEPAIQRAIRKSLKLSYTKSPVSKINNSGGIKRPQNIIYDSDASEKSTQFTKHVKEPETTRRVLPSRKAKCTPTSIISPIQLFDDLVSNADKLSQTTLSDDEEFMSEIKDTIYKQLQKAKKYDKESVKETNCAKKNDKDILNTAVQQTFISKPIELKSRDNYKVLKRSSEGDKEARKKQKVEDNNNIADLISASGATVSSVDDWFKRSEAGSSRAEEVNVTTRDSIQAVIEKLDTTLIEIHQNTSNKFVHLFASAQQQLSALKRERQSLYKRVAADVLAALFTLVDNKFNDLNKRSQEQDANFMAQLKEQASSVIREDLKQKRVMVQLLKEDVLAIAGHMANNNK